jgi:hypothetical protein
MTFSRTENGKGSGNLQVQQTPKPLAQEPAETPPLLVHSELKLKNKA